VLPGRSDEAGTPVDNPWPVEQLSSEELAELEKQTGKKASALTNPVLGRWFDPLPGRAAPIV